MIPKIPIARVPAFGLAGTIHRERSLIIGLMTHVLVELAFLPVECLRTASSLTFFLDWQGRTLALGSWPHVPGVGATIGVVSSLGNAPETDSNEAKPLSIGS